MPTKANDIAPAPYVDQSTEPWIRYGNKVIAGLVLGFLAFGLLSISGAVVANGVVNVETNYKAVQHLDGGIVAKILVRNGDRVAEGDVLIRLDDTAARTNLAAISSRANDLMVQRARLEAERDRAQAIQLPAVIADAQGRDPTLAGIVAAQQTLFRARMAAHAGELGVARKRYEQAATDVAGLAKLLAARRREAELSAAELASVKPLFDRGFANQQRLMPVQRENARLEGEVGKLTSDLARTRGAAAEAELRLAQVQKEYTQQVVDELRKIEAQLAEVSEQRTQLGDKMRRIELRAPRSGRVHAPAVHTEGGVIQAGSTVLQVIPEGEVLLVDAQIPPQDIDKVKKGQAAWIRFPAFNAKSTPRLEATVSNVSPAQMVDQQQQGRQYFTVQVALAKGEMEKLPKGHDLVPGMPAEVYIDTGGRSILSWLLKPLFDAMSRTMRET